MKIGFTGAHGTGKTSLMAELANLSEFADYSFIESSSREVARAGFQINQEADLFSQSLILQMRIAAELRVPKYMNYLSDRTPVDSIAYFLHQRNSVWPGNTPGADLVYNAQWQIAQEHMKRYNLIFYFPPFDFITDDGVRKTDKSYQSSIDNYIQSTLGLMGVKTIRINDGTIHDRANQVLDMVHFIS